MPIKYRQKRFSRLTKEQQQLKLQKDSEYEIAVQNLTVSWKKGEITQGDYQQQKSVLWQTYKSWAISNGLYEEVTPEQQLAEAEAGLDEQIQNINAIRAELGRESVEIKEMQ